MAQNFLSENRSERTSSSSEAVDRSRLKFTQNIKSVMNNRRCRRNVTIQFQVVGFILFQKLWSNQNVRQPLLQFAKRSQSVHLFSKSQIFKMLQFRGTQNKIHVYCNTWHGKHFILHRALYRINLAVNCGKLFHRGDRAVYDILLQCAHL